MTETFSIGDFVLAEVFGQFMFKKPAKIVGLFDVQGEKYATLEGYAAGVKVTDLRRVGTTTSASAKRPDINDTLRDDGEDAVRNRSDNAPQFDSGQHRRMMLDHAHEVFRRWLGEDYDLNVLDAVIAVAVAERLPGDPAWLLVISGSGNAKTETVMATSGLGAHVVSTISSDAALLSATSQKQKSKGATGGLLRQIGARGILTIKDATSILSMNREARATLLAALREIYDGQWVRDVGRDGGQSLSWKGRIVVIGACTTAWDQAHSVVAACGDRFVLIRSDSHVGRVGSGLRSVRNTGSEAAMRKEMADAIAVLVNSVDTSNIYQLTGDDELAIVHAADLVTLARTAVETDYRGNVVDAHAPEMPTRFAKQLTQIMRGAMAVGMEHNDALYLVKRCARDSMPQLRLEVLSDVALNPESRVIDIRRRLQKPRMTTDRTLEALHILGLLTCREQETARAGKLVQTRLYSLAPSIKLDPIF